MRVPNVASAGGAWVLENGHRTLLTLTGGRWPRRLGGMDTIELHTTGRSSGRRRSTLLTSPVHDPRRVVLVASKGGHDVHPDWYQNLAANPDVEITMNGTTRRMRARTATGTERAALWAQVTRAYRGYAGYQRNTDREIPVIVCEPVDAG